jgi:CheY-like chemotaxis protein
LPTLRSVIFRYGDIAALSDALSDARGALPVPTGESVGDGEWVLAIFEVGSRRRATAAAARGVRTAGDARLEFERRDWNRLVAFAAKNLQPPQSENLRAARPMNQASSARVMVAPESAPAPAESAPAASAPAAPESAPPVTSEVPRSRHLEDLPSSSALESSRIPFGARVLVVDDDGGTGDELRAMLTEMGLVAELVATTKRAEERMSTLSFDAIVLDLHAPGMAARRFVSKLRADARIADTPVLFISSRSTSRDVVDAFASGGDDFLPKPFRTPELAARIFGLLRRARLVQTVLSSRSSGR